MSGCVHGYTAETPACSECVRKWREIEQALGQKRAKFAWRCKFELYRSLLEGYSSVMDPTRPLGENLAKAIADEAQIAWEAFVLVHGQPEGS